MSLTKKYGVNAGEQVPLDIANKQAASVSAAMREREQAAAGAAAKAVERALRGADGTAKRTAKVLRAPAKRRKD